VGSQPMTLTVVIKLSTGCIWREFEQRYRSGRLSWPCDQSNKDICIRLSFLKTYTCTYYCKRWNV